MVDDCRLDSLMAMLTEDVVYLSPHEPVLVGKSAVRPWGDRYLKAYKIHWDKTTDGKWRVAREVWNSDLPVPSK